MRKIHMPSAPTSPNPTSIKVKAFFILSDTLLR